MSSGSYDLGADLFDYYPPIQERVRWIIGAKDLSRCPEEADAITRSKAGPLASSAPC